MNSSTSPITLKVLHVGSTTPSAEILLSIAVEQGFFAKHGLQVRLVFVAGTEVPELTPEHPFGLIGAPAAVLRAARAAELKILACFNTARISGRLIASPDISKPEGLTGARIGVRALGAGQWIQTMLAVRHLGLDVGRHNIRLVSIGDEGRLARALVAGDIDAAVFSQAQSRLLKARGFSDLLDLYPANLYAFPNALAVNAGHLQRFPDHARRLLAALIEAMAFCLATQNATAVLEAIMRGSEFTDRAAVRTVYDEFLLTAVRKPYPCVEQLRQMKKIMALQDPRVLRVSVQHLVEDRFVRELDDSGEIDRLYAAHEGGV